MKQSLNEFLAIRGLSLPISDYTLDKCRHPHPLTERQRKKLVIDGGRVSADYQQRRNAAIQEYDRLVAAGEIEPLTENEKMIQLARYGHPDNESTRAAQRACEKRGIKWRINTSN